MPPWEIPGKVSEFDRVAPDFGSGKSEIWPFFSKYFNFRPLAGLTGRPPGRRREEGRAVEKRGRRSHSKKRQFSESGEREKEGGERNEGEW